MSVEAGLGRNLPQPRLYVTDSLGDPYAAQTQFSSMLAPIGQSRKDADSIKRDEEITVVIGNPPYKEKAKGRGGWIERRNERFGITAVAVDAASGMGRQCARQTPLQSLCLFLALGNLEGVWDRVQGIHRRRRGRPDRRSVLYHRGGLFERTRLSEVAVGPAARLLAYMGYRLHTGGSSARGSNADIPRRATTCLHRPRRSARRPTTQKNGPSNVP